MAHPTKEFKTLHDQYRTLTEDRHLTKQKLTQADVEETLLNYGYFDIINGFETLLLKDKKDKSKGFITNNFEDFISLYELDLLLKKELLYCVSKFELRLKNIVCYEFTQRYCNTLGTTLEYLNKSNYENPRTQYNLNRNSFVVKAYTEDKFHFFKNTHRLGYDKVTKQLIKGNYAEFCKGKYDYVSHYTTPPLWTVIKTLDLGALLLMIQYLKPPTMEDVLARYNLSSTDAEMFISSIEIIKSLRNSTAHFNLINRFRTEGSIQINVNLINRLNLSPMNQGYRIKLFDTLKVLGQYENIIGIKKVIINYYDKKKCIKNEHLANILLERMGNKNIKDWKNL